MKDKDGADAPVDNLPEYQLCFCAVDRILPSVVVRRK